MQEKQNEDWRKNETRRKRNLSKEEEEKEQLWKELTETQGNSNIEGGKRYEEFINDKSQSAERTTMERRIRKALLKRNQEEFFGGALRLGE